MPAHKKSTSMSLSAEVLDEARAMGINISRAAEAGVLAEIKQERARRWKEENADAIKSWNKYVEENGIPLAEFRKF